jgi:hypothetical protein
MKHKSEQNTTSNFTGKIKSLHVSAFYGYTQYEFY